MKLNFSITCKSMICKINNKALIVVDYQHQLLKIKNIYRLSITVQIYEVEGWLLNLFWVS